MAYFDYSLQNLAQHFDEVYFVEEAYLSVIQGVVFGSVSAVHISQSEGVFEYL